MMEHHHTQARASWTPSLYSTSSSANPTTSTSLRPPVDSLYSSQYQDHRYLYSEAPRLPFAPLPPPPRDDPLAVGTSRLRYPPPSLPRPMISGSLSPRFQLVDKSVVTPAFSIAISGGSTPKRASDEERRAKHREAQRRFVKRKKIEMTQLKQLAVVLEKRHDLLQVMKEQEVLTQENKTLMQQLEEKGTDQSVTEDKDVNKPDDVKTEMKDECPRVEIKWEWRTFEW